MFIYEKTHIHSINQPINHSLIYSCMLLILPIEAILSISAQSNQLGSLSISHILLANRGPVLPMRFRFHSLTPTFDHRGKRKRKSQYTVNNNSKSLHLAERAELEAPGLRHRIADEAVLKRSFLTASQGLLG